MVIGGELTMIEKIKSTAFVKESYCLRILSKDDALFAVRTDKITTIAEKLAIKPEQITNSIDCIVDYNQFNALTKLVKEITQEGSCLHITIKNGGDYKLPFIDVEKMPDIPQHTGEVVERTFNFTDISKSTLKSHLTNDQRHIYSIDKGIYATNFLSAAKGKSMGDEEMLYPADILSDVIGTLKFSKDDTTVTISGPDYILQTARPILEDPEQFQAIVALFDEEVTMVPAKDLQDQINRIAMFDEAVTFKGDQILSACGTEPSPIHTDEELVFDTAALAPYLVDVKEVGITSEGNLRLTNVRGVDYLVSRRTYEE